MDVSAQRWRYVASEHIPREIECAQLRKIPKSRRDAPLEAVVPEVDLLEMLALA